MCVCLHVMKLSYFSCEFFFSCCCCCCWSCCCWCCLVVKKIVIKLKMKHPQNVLMTLYAALVGILSKSFANTHFYVLFFSNLLDFCVSFGLIHMQMSCHSKALRNSMHVKSLHFFPIPMLKVHIPSGNRLSGQLQNKISTFPGKLCCFVTSAKKNSHTNIFWMISVFSWMSVSWWFPIELNSLVCLLNDKNANRKWSLIEIRPIWQARKLKINRITSSSSVK